MNPFVVIATAMIAWGCAVLFVAWLMFPRAKVTRAPSIVPPCPHLEQESISYQAPEHGFTAMTTVTRCVSCHAVIARTTSR